MYIYKQIAKREMEKIKLNNQVVRMRKHVKQAKVHSINKLVKQVKLLQNRKGKETQVLKAKRKAERYLEEISLLKKVKPDDVSKLALSRTKNWKEVLSQKNSTLEDRCIAILASYEPVQKEVEIFHNSNKDLASKISEFIKEWNEKNKICKDSYQKKKSNFKNLQNNTSLLKVKMTGGLLNHTTNQPKTTEEENSKSLNTETDNSLLIDNSHESESERKNKSVQKLSTSRKSSQNSFYAEEVSKESHKNENLEENIMEIETSDKVENKQKVLVDDESELENYYDSDAGNEAKNDCESSNESVSNDESDMEKNMSEKDYTKENFPGIDLETKSSKIEDAGGQKLRPTAVSEFSKDSTPSKKSFESNSENLTACSSSVITDNIGFKAGENKLKAITMLNLEDFKDLDEIPVNSSAGNDDESEEEEGTDDDSLNASQNDPFFLSRDEAISTENKLIDYTESNNFVSVNEIFERKEKSNNQRNCVKNFQKPLSISRFSSKYSSKFKTEKKFDSCKKDKFMSKNQKDRFQFKSRDSFDSGDPEDKFQPYKYKNFGRYNDRNQEGFKKKTFLETYGKNKRSLSKNGDNSFRKSKEPHKKDDANSKPLHPSWEAKRKQKELINTSFQGKKIKFED